MNTTVTNLGIQFFGMAALYNPSMLQIEQIENTGSVNFFPFCGVPSLLCLPRNCLVCATEATKLLAKSVCQPAPRLANPVEGKFKTHFRYFVESAADPEQGSRRCFADATKMTSLRLRLGIV